MGTARPSIPTAHFLGLLITFPLWLPVLACDDPADPGDELVDVAPVRQWTYDLATLPALAAVWGSGPDAVFVAGEMGQVLSWNGAEWSDLGPDGFSEALVGLWGTSTGELFAVARDNYLLHYDGTAWDVREAPVAGDTQLYDVWGTSPENVFAAGWGGHVFHFDGSDWTKLPDAPMAVVRGIWGASVDDVFAVGTSAIAHYDGSTWTTMDAPLPERGLSGVWGTASDNVYAVGSDGWMLRYDGADWTRVDVGTEHHLYDVWGSAADDLYVVGSSAGTGIFKTGVAFHYDGSSWAKTDAPVVLSSVWGTGPEDVWAVGPEGTVVHYDGTEWSQARGGMGRSLEGLHGFSNGTVYAAGGSIVLRNGGSGWEVAVAVEESPHYAIWGESDNDFFVVGGGMNYIMRVRNGAWSRHAVPGGWGSYRGVWGSSSSDVFVGGSRIMHFDGAGWTVMLGADAEFEVTDVWGSSPTDVYVVQDRIDPRMLHYDGTDWSPVGLPEVEWGEGAMGQPYLNGLWGSSTTDIFAVGGPGAILHFDGERWTAMDSGTDVALHAVGGSSPENVYAVGADCTVLHYDGTVWQPVDLALDCRTTLHGVWLEPGSDVLIVGEAGTILRGIR